MADPYFFCADLGNGNARVQLALEESRHLRGARRYREGEELWLFDGRGTVARGRLVESAKSGASIEIVERRRESPPSPVVHLACALPKGDRQATLLDMATQLGIASFTPLTCERSVVKASNVERLARISLEACKQSRRAHLPELHAPKAPVEFSEWALGEQAAVWIAHASPDARALSSLLAMASTRPTVLALLIGPEGGFTTAEIDALTVSGGQLVSLGSPVLRVETAAIGMLAAVRLAVAT